MPNLIPSATAIMTLLQKSGAYRHGHFVYPSGKHAANYFQMPLAFRNYDTARTLAVALSRLFRVEKSISSLLPNVAIVSPGPGGMDKAGRIAAGVIATLRHSGRSRSELPLRTSLLLEHPSRHAGSISFDTTISHLIVPSPSGISHGQDPVHRPDTNPPLR